MQYSSIFPSSTEFPNPLYPILAVTFCTGLYYAISIFNAPPITRKLLTLAEDFGYVDRTLIYLILLNFPPIILGLCSLVTNNSIIGIQASTDMDIIHVVVLGGYICYIEQSRQTPICGFLFIRDLIFIIGCLAGLISLHFEGTISDEYGFILGAFYFVYYIMLQFEEKMEDGVLRLLQLRGNDVYNSAYLLTQDKKESNFLEIKEIIEENKEAIKEEIEEYQQIVNKVVKNQDEQLILLNFAKLFLPFKKANEIQEAQLLQYHLQTIQDDWKDQHQDTHNEDSSEDQDEGPAMTENKDISENNILNKPTLTDDFVVENYEKEDGAQSVFEKVFKYAFYPIYAFSLTQGRIRYFLDYFAIALLCGSLWFITSSFAYFTKATSNNCLQFFSSALAVIMALPSVRYYIRMSALSDFDFLNIFIQSAILKTVVFSIGITILTFVKGKLQIDSGIGSGISLILAIVTYALFGIFMIAQKFATLRSNLKFFVGLVAISFLLRIVTELAINLFRKE